MSTATPKIATLLQQILQDKTQQVGQRRQRRPLDVLEAQLKNAPAVRGFADAIERGIRQRQTSVIAEIKKASPSKGLICSDFSPERIARAYAASGACCLSVLTEEHYFQGSDAYLLEARAACTLPVLRKDFVVDSYQILESRVLGADAILLIAAALSTAQLGEFHAYARSLGLDVLVEVHDEPELLNALSIQPQLLGINNRNLHDFSVSLNVSLELSTQVPESVLLISESGIRDAADISRLQQAGIYGFLVGESLMRTTDPGTALKALIQRVP